MTQLVNKASSWRTLRRKVVVGASSLALVAGMGVALAPSAMAANPGSFTVTITDGGAPAGDFPAQSVLDNTTTTDGEITIKAVSGANVTPATGNHIAVRVTANGSGIGVTNALTDLSLEQTTTDTWSVDLIADGTGSANSLTAVSAALGSTGATDPLELTVDGTWTGQATFVVSVVEAKTADNTVVKVLGSTSFSTTIGEEADATFFDDTKPADYTAAVRDLTAGLNSDFSANLVKTAEFPDANLVLAVSGATATWTAPTGTSTVGTLKDTAGNIFSVDLATGKVSAVAANVTKLSNVANPAVEFTLTSGANNVTVTLSAGFKDDASIATTLKDDVYAAVNAEIIEGYSDGTFRPTTNVSRQAFAAFAARFLDGKISTSLETNANMMCDADNPSAFSDVANNAPFCAVIRDLAKAGVTNGYADGTFKPAAPISRQAISAMLFRVNNLVKGLNVDTAAPAPATAPFKDVAVDAPFAAEIAWAAGTTPAITTGYEDGTFRPTSATSRQATAVFFTRMAAL